MQNTVNLLMKAIYVNSLIWAVLVAMCLPEQTWAVPVLISHQGFVRENGAPLNGTGMFKFALVNAGGSVTYWSNDGTSTGGSEPQAGVPLTVAEGFYNLVLGDASIAGMTALPPAVFENDELFLRTWFITGTGPQLLTPDVRITAAAFALRARDAEAVGGIPASQVLQASQAAQVIVSSTQAALAAINQGSGVAVYGYAKDSNAIYGFAEGQFAGIYGSSTGSNAVVGQATSIFSAIYGGAYQGPGVQGESTQGVGVKGTSYGQTAGVSGTSAGGYGVYGYSDFSHGLVGEATGMANGVRGGAYAGAGVYGLSSYGPGIYGFSTLSNGLVGEATGSLNAVQGNAYAGAGVSGYSGFGYGVYGYSDTTNGIVGEATGLNAGVSGGSHSGRGVSGSSTFGYGAYGTSLNNNAVVGEATGYFAGVYGVTNLGSGVAGSSWGGYGVYGYSQNSNGVVGESSGSYAGVYGIGHNSVGVYAIGAGQNPGVIGYSASGYGLLGDSGGDYGVASKKKMIATQFEVGNADIAEYFPVRGPEAEPGDVMVIAESAKMELERCAKEYDCHAAGVVSTAPGVALAKKDGVISPGHNEGEKLIAMAGRVPCKVDASYGAIRPGDLLTTSQTPGHARKAEMIELNGRQIAPMGAIIGKALESWDQGAGVIRILVSLQ